MSSSASKPKSPGTPRPANLRQPAGARDSVGYHLPSQREHSHEEATGTEDSTAKPRRYPEDRPRPYPVPAPEVDTDSESDSSGEEAWADAQEKADEDGEGGNGEGGEGGEGIKGDEGFEGGQAESENNEAEDEPGYVDDDFDFGEFINYSPPDYASPGYAPTAAAAAINIRPDYDDTREFLILTSRPRHEPIATPPHSQPLSSHPPFPSHATSLYNHGVNPTDPFFNPHHTNNTARAGHTPPPYNPNHTHTDTLPPPPSPPFNPNPCHTLPHQLAAAAAAAEADLHAQELQLQYEYQARLRETRLRAAALRQQMQTAAARHNYGVQTVGYCAGCGWCGGERGQSWSGGGSGSGGSGGGGSGWDGRWVWPGTGTKSRGGGY